MSRLPGRHQVVQCAENAFCCFRRQKFQRTRYNELVGIFLPENRSYLVWYYQICAISLSQIIQFGTVHTCTNSIRFSYENRQKYHKFTNLD